MKEIIKKKEPKKVVEKKLAKPKKTKKNDEMTNKFFKFFQKIKGFFQ